MIIYTESELKNLCESLQSISVGESFIHCKILQIYENYRVIMLDYLISMLNCKRKRDFKKAYTRPLKLVYYGERIRGRQGNPDKFYEYITEEEFKEIFDVIFLLEFSRIPLFINDMPEIAKWRLKIGK